MCMYVSHHYVQVRPVAHVGMDRPDRQTVQASPALMTTQYSVIPTATHHLSYTSFSLTRRPKGTCTSV